MAVFLQAYWVAKLVVLVTWIGASALAATVSRRVVVYPRLVAFYIAVSAIGFVWAAIGFMNPSNSQIGIVEAVRLYVVWNVVFLTLYTCLRSEGSLRTIHGALVLAGILISVINVVAVVEVVSGTDWIPESVREQMDLYVGLHSGYIQIRSKNIGALFLIVPYLLALRVRSDAGWARSKSTTSALVLCLGTVVISGRRALWIVVAVTPVMILGLAYITRAASRIQRRARWSLIAYTVAAGLGALTLRLLPVDTERFGALSRLTEAFSSEDERSIQKPYLLEGFARSPLVGSGFGGNVGYVRNEERPWIFELTYHQMLFNLGIVGVGLLACLFFTYALRVCRLIRRFGNNAAIPFALMIGLVALFVGAYSNPYFGSFDYLFLVGFLPYLSTFRSGFDVSESFSRA